MKCRTVFQYALVIMAATALPTLCLPGCNTERAANEKVVHEAWYAVHMRGSKIGYSHTKTVQTTENEQTVYRTDIVNQLDVKKGKDWLKITITTSTTSTPEGKLLVYQSRLPLGATPTVSKGTVVGDQLVIEQTVAGKTTRRTLDLPADLVVGDACRRSLIKKPMAAGDKRVFHTFDPELGQLQTEEFVAVGYERVKLLEGSRKLLRLDHLMTTHTGEKRRSTLWVDQHGVPLKTYLTGIETYHTTQRVATAKGVGGKFNLLFDTTVKIARPLPQGTQTPRARYRMRLKNADPSEIFSPGTTQAVRRIDDKSAEISVRAVDPKTPLDARFPKSKGPTAADRNANTMIQSDDARVKALAHEVAKGKRDPWAIATALESHIHRSMHEVNFSQAFATAAEVAKSRTGDCSEYAVLLTAVCRARGIPARVAMGLVYMPRSQAFGYHMWTEAWIVDRWVPLDATLGRGGIGAGHLKVADTPLSDGLSDLAFYKIAQLLAAEPKIELVDTK